MTQPYTFISDTEPTKEQLDELMLAVSEEVKERAAKADAKFKALQKQALQQTQEIWQQKQGKNDHR
jgi:arsenate reductase-like glutaredoxin family protein